jgi:hypothetical protein
VGVDWMSRLPVPGVAFGVIVRHVVGGNLGDDEDRHDVLGDFRPPRRPRQTLDR